MEPMQRPSSLGFRQSKRQREPGRTPAVTTQAKKSTAANGSPCPASSVPPPFALHLRPGSGLDRLGRLIADMVVFWPWKKQCCHARRVPLLTPLPHLASTSSTAQEAVTLRRPQRQRARQYHQAPLTMRLSRAPYRGRLADARTWRSMVTRRPGQVIRPRPHTAQQRGDQQLADSRSGLGANGGREHGGPSAAC